jgi:glycosyltransferase involved in cell wall biosynthesis
LEFPPVTILIVTFNRLGLLKKTVEALVDNIDYPQDKLYWLLADDCSEPGYTDKIKKWPIWKGKNLAFSVTETNKGWGANVNQALDAVQTDFVFQIEDDYILSKKLDLKEGIALLLADEKVGYIRYRGHSGKGDMWYLQDEANVAPFYPEYKQAENYPGVVQYLLLNCGSPSVYIYTHGAHLKHKKFHAFYGKYFEHLKLGLCEERYAIKVKEMMPEKGAPRLVILVDWIPMWFIHTGESYQNTAWDKDRS